MEKKLILICDPPKGWQFGFPKPVPKEVEENKLINEWLIKEGYPEKLIKEHGDYFFCRYWYEEEEKN